MIECPVCGVSHPPRATRCGGCGADFLDPDVQALEGSMASAAELLDGAEPLSASAVLGVSADGLRSGTALFRLGFIGLALCTAGLVIPSAPDFRHYVFPWEAGGAGLVLPIVCMAIALPALAVSRRRPGLGAAALVLAGGTGLTFLANLGAAGAAAEHVPLLFPLGVATSGGAVVARLFHPGSRLLAHIAAGTAVLTIVAMLLPTSTPELLLPAELRFFQAPPASPAIPLAVLIERTGRAHLTFALGFLTWMPVVVAPAAAAFAHVKPGVWDRAALVLRPLAWLLVLYPVLLHGFGVFNLMGWDQVSWVSYGDHIVSAGDFTQAAMTGRAKLMLLGAGMTLWACFGSCALFSRLVRDGAPDADQG